MTQEEKELLIRDLCARLPYGVFVKEEIPSLLEEPVMYIYDYHPHITKCKPYLRPMSSMTVEEGKKLFQLMGKGTDIQRIDFYISHHLDYRGLIERGLALEAPEDMYE